MNKVPINRINKFYSDADFEFNITVGMEYLHTDLNMKMVLYQVDHSKTKNDDVYGEVMENEIIFLPPVEFNGQARFEEAKNSAYKKGDIRYNEVGNMIIHVYKRHLEELGVDIKYGDYIGYYDDSETLRYYTVVNDGRINSHNKSKMWGERTYFRRIVCVPAKNEFNGF